MSNSIELNINDQIEVELTFYGKAILENYIRDIFVTYPDVELMVKKHIESYESHRKSDGLLISTIYKMPLWEIMHIFGKEMYMGNNNQVFVSNTLIKQLEKN